MRSGTGGFSAQSPRAYGPLGFSALNPPVPKRVCSNYYVVLGSHFTASLFDCNLPIIKYYIDQIDSSLANTPISIQEANLTTPTSIQLATIMKVLQF